MQYSTDNMLPATEMRTTTVAKKSTTTLLHITKNIVDNKMSPSMRQFVCYCGRRYKSKGSLTDHQRWECGKEPTFQCSFCFYCAKRKKHLRRHVLCVHKMSFDE